MKLLEKAKMEQLEITIVLILVIVGQYNKLL